MESGNLTVLDKEELFRQAADIFVRAANSSIDENGVFSVALSGGSTPKELYSLLAKEYSHSIPWEKVHVFFGDERCVPPDHPESNFRMASESLLSRVDIPPENIHRMKGENEPGDAAAEYTGELRKFFKSSAIPAFDLILLGLGEDGHTASLFPGSEAVNEVFVPVVSQYIPELEAHRLTLTPPVLLNAVRIMSLVTGPDKAHALNMVLEGPYEPDRYPAQLLRTADGEVTWLADPAAASQLNLDI